MPFSAASFLANGLANMRPPVGCAMGCGAAATGGGATGAAGAGAGGGGAAAAAGVGGGGAAAAGGGTAAAGAVKSPNAATSSLLSAITHSNCEERKNSYNEYQTSRSHISKHGISPFQSQRYLTEPIFSYTNIYRW